MQNLKDKGKFIARSLSSLSIDPILTSNVVKLKSIIDAEKSLDDDVEYLLILKYEDFLVDTFDEGAPVDLIQTRKKESERFNKIELISLADNEVYDIANPIKIDNNIIGSIRVGMKLNSAKSNLSLAMGWIVVITLILALTSIVIGFSLTNISVIKPIKILKELTKNIEKGDFYQSVYIKSNNELGQLADSFNKMSLSIRTREDYLRTDRNRFSSLLDNMPVIVEAIDIQKKYCIWNKECEKVTGFTKVEILGKEVIGNLTPINTVTDLLDDKASSCMQNDDSNGLETELISKDGSKKIISWVNISKHIQVPGISSWAVGMDITEPKIIKDELELSRIQLQNFAMHMQNSLEEVRSQIAREIHDELGQLLSVLKLDIKWLFQRIPSENVNLISKIKSMSEFVDKTIDTVRRISTNLRPEILDVLGLEAALESESGKFQNRTGIITNTTIDLKNSKVEKDIAICIYRIFQEALTNISLHSKASAVEMSLFVDNGILYFVISDDGKGITEKDLNNPMSLGLRGIRERIYALQGNIVISGIENKGSKIEISLPL